MLGYFFRYGGPLIALALSVISGPCALIVAPLSFIGLIGLEMAGTRLLKSVQHDKLSGGTKHVGAAQKIWNDTNRNDLKSKGEEPYKRFRKEVNKAINKIFKGRKTLRNRLRLKKGQGLDRMVKAFFHVQALNQGNWKSKAFRKIGRTPIPLIRTPLLIFSWMARALLTLLTFRTANKLVKAAKL